jgi:hypothetical protein
MVKLKYASESKEDHTFLRIKVENDYQDASNEQQSTDEVKKEAKYRYIEDELNFITGGSCDVRR